MKTQKHNYYMSDINFKLRMARARRAAAIAYVQFLMDLQDGAHSVHAAREEIDNAEGGRKGSLGAETETAKRSEPRCRTRNIMH